MSEIERERVVGKSEEELDELCCGICHDIFDEPVVTQCCRQTYCTVCITQWLIENNTCPNDRIELNVKDLVKAPRMVINMINLLTIKCENYDECQTILTVEEMTNHSKSCGKIVCNNCEELKSYIKSKDRENLTLKQQLKSMETLVKDVTDEITKLRMMTPNQRSQERAIEIVRNEPNFKISYEFGLNIQEKQFLLDQTKLSLQTNNGFNSVCKSIHDSIEKNTNLKEFRWVVMVEFKNTGLGLFLLCNRGIHIEFDEIIVKMYGLNKILKTRHNSIAKTS